MNTDTLRSSLLGIGAMSLLGALSCGANDPGPVYDHLDLSSPSNPPQQVVLDPDRVAIPEGIAVRAEPIPIGDDGEPLRGEVAGAVVHSSDPKVLSVLDGPEEGEVVLVGVRRGQTALVVRIQGVEVGTVPVEVTAQ